MAHSGNNAPFFVDREVIVLTERGVWMADGTEITHEPTRTLFARSLMRGPKGYSLVIGHETKWIDVQDTALFVHALRGDAVSGWELVLSDGSREALNPPTLSYRPGRLTCRVKVGASGPARGELLPLCDEEARFLSAPYMDLLRDVEKDGTGYYLVIAGRRVELGKG